MALLFFYLFLALIVSFICSILEAVLLSIPISFLRAREAAGRRYATYMIKIKKHINKPLSAILTMNTVAHTIGAAGVGSQGVKVFGDAYFGIISAILTILILVLTEILPKTIGARYWRNLVWFASGGIRIMIFITYPLVILFAYFNRLIASNKSELTISREEISALADIGKEEGILAEKENKIIQNLIRLKSLKATDVMTPRVVVAVADESMSLEEFSKVKDYLRFSRIPVFRNNPEYITGYVFRQTVFEKLSEDNSNLKLTDIRRNITVLHRNTPLLSVWEKLLETKEHIALIVDEYGGMDGIVTMEDIIESLLGFEIIDEKDTITDMRQYARERWEMRQEKYRLIEKIEKNIKE